MSSQPRTLASATVSAVRAIRTTTPTATAVFADPRAARWRAACWEEISCSRPLVCPLIPSTRRLPSAVVGNERAAFGLTTTS